MATLGSSLGGDLGKKRQKRKSFLKKDNKIEKGAHVLPLEVQTQLLGGAGLPAAASEASVAANRPRLGASSRSEDLSLTSPRNRSSTTAKMEELVETLVALPQSEKLATLSSHARGKPDTCLGFFHETLRNTLIAMNLTREQAAGVLRHIDTVMTAHQHEELQRQVALSPAASKRLKDLKTFAALQRQVQPAVLLQAVARGYLVRKRLARFSKEAVNRIRVRNVKYLQLLRIERQYSGQLQSIVKSYLHPLRKSPPKGVDAGALAHIFSNIEAMADVHTTLLGSLEVVQEDRDYPFFSGIGNCFMDISEVMLPIYGSYVENYMMGADILQATMDSSPKFVAMLKEVEQHGVGNLKDLLRLPIDQIGQYEMKLNALLACSRKEDPGFETLVSAAAMIQKTADFLHRKVETAGHMAQVRAVERRIHSEKPLNLVTAKRRFVREGHMRVDDKKNCNVFLFSDEVVVCDSDHKFWKLVPLDSVEVEDLADAKYGFAISQGGTPPKRTTFQLKNSPDKAAWMADFITIIDSHQKTKVYGIPLKAVLELEERPNGIPIVLERTQEVIRRNGMDVEGIFRVSGDSAVIAETKRLFDTEGAANVDLNKLTVNDVAGLMKLFYREFPEPLFPFNTFEELVHLQTGREQDLPEEEFTSKLVALICDIPEEKRRLIHFLFSFLHELQSHKAQTKMDARNLAVVFAPNLIRPERDTVHTALMSPAITKIVNTVIERFDVLWPLVEASAPTPSGACGKEKPKDNEKEKDKEKDKDKERKAKPRGVKRTSSGDGRDKLKSSRGSDGSKSKEKRKQ